ncbi:protein tyrosine phosphatase [Paucidesulfovibrio gracilis DSM 16080]|uniref:Protein tyrosine phosphatase n=1 Tax=Paucidesulfovibrio gracilis DSM 16080 TaxID=1121449 RepID=A0A1T4XIV6_9BACT|nr:arsenate reductase ArsC [Paucidesulfovibrio gracilis]SKA89499.1 protein tyrosine phosphatase [Paucidesulfovibrio gracilis DSM 16080]
MSKVRVLFICNHNSARSQMAEALLQRFGGEEFEVESAGLEPTQINPLVVEVMQEEGIDLSEKRTQSVFDLFRAGRLYDYVITVCDDEQEKKCPVFPGVANRWHWPFPDPAKVTGSHEEKLAQVRAIRESIKERVRNPFTGSFRTDSPFSE